MKSYLEGHSLHKSATFTNMNYKGTVVNWASYIREMFCQFVYDEYEMLHFDDDVEIDESLFGRNIKYNRGNPTGHRIWIFGIVHRRSNTLGLYPMDNRDAKTCFPTDSRHTYGSFIR